MLVELVFLLLAEFGLVSEGLLQRSVAAEGARVAERSTDAIPQCEVLSVVARVEQVVVGVVGRSVDYRLERRRDVEFPVVDRHRPDVDEQVESQVDELVHREEKDVDVVGNALQEAVDRVEGVAGVGRRNFPGVVRLVEGVDEAVVQEAVDPVDEAVGEEDERDDGERNCKPTVL